MAPAPADKVIVSVVWKKKKSMAEPSPVLSPDPYGGAGSRGASVAVCALITGAAGWGLATRYPVHWHLCKCLVAIRAEDAWRRCKKAWRSSSVAAAAARSVATDLFRQGCVRFGYGEHPRFRARPGRAELSPQPTRRDSDADMPEPER